MAGVKLLARSLMWIEMRSGALKDVFDGLVLSVLGYVGQISHLCFSEQAQMQLKPEGFGLS